MDLKNFFKRPLYHIAGRISKVSRDFQNHSDQKLILQKDKVWNDLFNDKNFFEYFLNKEIKINLYKDSVLSRLIYDGFEEQESDFLIATLKEDDVFIDAGTNIGLFSLLASKLVGAKGQVVCFEPSPLTYKRLVENVLLNEIKNIDCRNIGLSDKQEELLFYTSLNGHDAWNSFAPSQDNKLEKEITVPVSTLDIELQNIDKARIKLVKIDVEGWEKFVLHGGKDFFLNYQPIVMVEFTEENTFNAGYSVHEIFDIMEGFGYTWYRICDGELQVEVKKLRYPYVNLIAINKNRKEAS